jgi:predicted RNase H-like HicB family nuclease
MTDYRIDVFWSEDDGGYIADIPALEVCSAFGATPAEAQAEVECAKAAWLEVARAEGRAIPAPDFRRDEGGCRETQAQIGKRRRRTRP